MPQIHNIRTFKATGHSAAANISLGFEPRFVILYNETTITEAGVYLWAATDGDGDGMKVADTGAGAVDLAMEATDGISGYEGGDEPDGTDAYQDESGTALTVFSTSGLLTAAGITIGTAISADGDVIHGIAFG